MTISIITAVFNASKTIEACIQSISSQTYPDLEHIIVDGGSTDRTLEIIEKVMNHESPVTNHQTRVPRVISEPDNGIYDALNKGIRMAAGDLVGFLHADDIYASDSVIEKVAEVMKQNNSDSCYGDLLYVDKNDTNRTIRYWKSSPFASTLLKKGWMPPHPTFFVRRKAYEKYGLFDTSFKIAADYELMLRFLAHHKISTCYIPEVLVKMRMGGASNRSLQNLFRKSSEDYRAMKMHQVGGLASLLRKNLSKVPQFFRR
jgi:glycosyltransferase